MRDALDSWGAEGRVCSMFCKQEVTVVLCVQVSVHSFCLDFDFSSV